MLNTQAQNYLYNDRKVSLYLKNVKGMGVDKNVEEMSDDMVH